MKRYLQQPWATWVVAALCLLFAPLLYGHMHLGIYFRPDIVTTQGQFVEAVFRLAGMAFLYMGAFVLFLKQRWALLLVIVGFLLYLAPWGYRYYELIAYQPEPHLKWHMFRVYPRIAWEWLPMPSGFLIFALLAVRELKKASIQSPG